VGYPQSHGFTPVATRLDRFAVRFGPGVGMSMNRYQLFVIGYWVFVIQFTTHRSHDILCITSQHYRV